MECFDGGSPKHNQLGGLLPFFKCAKNTVRYLYYNFKKTNMLYGIVGSTLQLGLFMPLAYVSTLLVVLMLLGVIFGKVGATPVRIVK